MESVAGGGDGQRGHLVLIVLSSAMFIYVIDTTIMNVSISALVDDLDTTVSGVQTAITVYTLTMAAFMLTGGKLGDILGSKRAFRIGLVVYGVGTTITALAPSLGFVLFGWSILEGLGSALIVPAINTLVRANYAGSKRATAFGVLFGVAAAGGAFGPLIGGWLTTNLSWRVAFGMEAVIVVVVLAASKLLVDAPPVEPRPVLDGVGVVLSALGLGMFVLGVLRSGQVGWSDTSVLVLAAGGIVVLVLFWCWISRREARGESALVHPSIFRHHSISAGLPILSTQTFAQAGLLFLIPVFAQSVLGLDAFQTGLTLLPLSFGVLLTSTLSPPLGRRIYPRTIIQSGLLLLFAGGYVLARALPDAADGSDLAPGLLVGGVAIGLIAGQLPNLVLSGVDRHEASEASGLQGTAQNLGMALGTAVIGTVVLGVALSAIGDRVESLGTIPVETKDEITAAVQRPFERADAAALEAELATLTTEQQDELAALYRTATLRGFQVAILTGGGIALLGAALAFRLPARRIEGDPAPDTTVKEVVRSATIPTVQFEMEELRPDPDPPTDPGEHRADDA